MAQAISLRPFREFDLRHQFQSQPLNLFHHFCCQGLTTTSILCFGKISKRAKVYFQPLKFSETLLRGKRLGLFLMSLARIAFMKPSINFESRLLLSYCLLHTGLGNTKILMLSGASSLTAQMKNSFNLRIRTFRSLLAGTEMQPDETTHNSQVHVGISYIQFAAR